MGNQQPTQLATGKGQGATSIQYQQVTNNNQPNAMGNNHYNRQWATGNRQQAFDTNNQLIAMGNNQHNRQWATGNGQQAFWSTSNTNNQFYRQWATNSNPYQQQSLCHCRQ
jgi:hypothetical protein